MTPAKAGFIVCLTGCSVPRAAAPLSQPADASLPVSDGAQLGANPPKDTRDAAGVSAPVPEVGRAPDQGSPLDVGVGPGVDAPAVDAKVVVDTAAAVETAPPNPQAVLAGLVGQWAFAEGRRTLTCASGFKTDEALLATSFVIAASADEYSLSAESCRWPLAMFGAAIELGIAERGCTRAVAGKQLLPRADVTNGKLVVAADPIKSVLDVRIEQSFFQQLPIASGDPSECKLRLIGKATKVP